MRTYPLLLLALLLWTPNSHAQTIRFVVGGTTFCVPSDNLIPTSYWVPTNTGQLRDDGFAFIIPTEKLPQSLSYIPAPNIKGDPLPISGTVEADRKDEWLQHLPPDNYWRQLAELPSAIVSLDETLHQIRAYQTPSRDRWMIWAISPSMTLSPKSIEDGGSIVALCHRTDFRSIGLRKVDETTTCDRRIRGEGLLLSYTFGGSNLSNLAKLDTGVWAVLRSWQCK